MSATTISTSTSVNPEMFVTRRMSPSRSDRAEGGGPGRSPTLPEAQLRLEHAVAGVRGAGHHGLLGQRAANALAETAVRLAVDRAARRVVLRIAPVLRVGVVVDVRVRGGEERVHRRGRVHRVVEVHL